MTNLAPEHHPDPDRWWNRKWKAACWGFGFSIAAVIAGLILSLTGAAEPAYPYVKLGVILGFSPMGVFLGLAEINNAVRQIWK